MQVSKSLGHSSFVLTLTTYADYIREDDTAAPNFVRPVVNRSNTVVNLMPQTSRRLREMGSQQSRLCDYDVL